MAAFAETANPDGKAMPATGREGTAAPARVSPYAIANRRHLEAAKSAHSSTPPISVRRPHTFAGRVQQR
jgi:hypothetical protein